MKLNNIFSKKIYFIIFLSIFSLLINQYYGNRGVYPLDSFIIFDAGFNIISGQHPFKDYWSITGPLLDYFQSFFFLIFGINWFSYVLHASAMNMALAIFSFYFFCNLNLPKIYAFIYSLGISLLAYPSAGTPFVDHHAVIFSVMALYSISIAILNKENIFWLLTSVFITLSFFSKQIPSAYILIFFSIFISIYFLSNKNFTKKNLFYIFLGFLLPFIVISIIFFINEIPIINFLIQYIYYPSSIGNERISTLNINIKNLIGQFKLIYVSIIPFVGILFYLINMKGKKLKQRNEIFILLLFLGTLSIFVYCQLVTKNQILIFFLIPIMLAVSHAYTIRYLNKKYIIYAILVFFIFSTTKNHIRFNHHKKFMELADVNFEIAEDAGKIDKKLSGLKWISPNYSQNPLKEINLLIDTKNILMDRKANKIIISHYNFFSGILENSFASPNKWYDKLSFPNDDSKFYNVYKDFFISKIKNNKIEYIYAVGKNKELYFKKLINHDECAVSKKLNEILTEIEIKKCRF